jgi:hypothetical protein
MLLSTSADYRRAEDDHGDDEADLGDEASVGGSRAKSKAKKRTEIFQCEKCSKYVCPCWASLLATCLRELIYVR